MNLTEYYQRAFAAYLRDPQHNPLPLGINEKRMNVYVELLFNNIHEVLARTFPVAHSILPPTHWQKLIREFYALYPCQTPYFNQIAGEFIQWFSNYFAKSQLRTSYPFLLELMHYEWIEIALLLADSAINWPNTDEFLTADYLNKPLQFNPLLLLQAYQYPVQSISIKHIPQESQPTYLIILKNRHHKVDFIELNAITAHLIQLLQTGLTVCQGLQQVSAEIQYIDQTQWLEYGLQLIRQLRSQDCIVT